MKVNALPSFSKNHDNLAIPTHRKKLERKASKMGKTNGSPFSPRNLLIYITLEYTYGHLFLEKFGAPHSTPSRLVVNLSPIQPLLSSFLQRHPVLSPWMSQQGGTGGTGGTGGGHGK
eukprot:scaffold89179_cov53-Attheya_sp.AAC.2